MTPSGGVIMGASMVSTWIWIASVTSSPSTSPFSAWIAAMTLSMYSAMTFTYSYSSFISSEASGPLTSSRRMDSIRSYSSLT